MSFDNKKYRWKYSILVYDKLLLRKYSMTTLTTKKRLKAISTSLSLWQSEDLETALTRNLSGVFFRVSYLDYGTNYTQSQFSLGYS